MSSDISYTIESLLNCSFSKRQFQEKKQIVCSGRPMPDLSDLSTKCKLYTRHFRKILYEKTIWLTGSKKLKKLFCWPCLLFSNKTCAWNTTGYSDLSNIYTAIQTHQRSRMHIIACLDMNSFKNISIEESLNDENKLYIQQYNETVRNHRRIIKRLIDIVIYLGSKGLLFGGSNESPQSHKKGHYVGLINLLSQYDIELKNHLSSDTVFSCLSNNIQNNLIDSIVKVILNKIHAEIENSIFASILLDETSDATSVSHLSTVVRYVTNNVVVERFVGFTDVSKDRSVNSLYGHVCKVVTNFNCDNKLIGQTYDGAVTMTSDLNELQAKVRDRYPKAIFVHCLTHELNLALSQACISIKSCRIFFSHLQSLGFFIKNSPMPTSAIDDIVKKLFPRVGPRYWSYTSQLVSAAKENRINLISLFDSIIDQPHDWDDDTVDAAFGFKYKLCNPDFIFLLEIFSEIFSHTDDLCKILQSKENDVLYCIQEVDKTLAILEEKSKDFSRFFESNDVESENERPLINKRNDTYVHYRSLHDKIYGIILEQLRIRFQSLRELLFFELLNHGRFKKYSKHFPNEALASLKNKYKNDFDIVRLENELNVIYSSERIFNQNAAKIMSNIVKRQLMENFPELYKLCTLILTIPSTTGSRKSSFSALKRIKTFQRISTEQERKSSLALMFIESELLASMQHSEQFYNEVINEFARKETSIELSYK